jgi:hypothetical protein
MAQVKPGAAVTPKFALGQVVATPPALRAFTDAGESPLPYLSRHSTGDWGDLSDQDKMENDFSVMNEQRTLNSNSGVKKQVKKSKTRQKMPRNYRKLDWCEEGDLNPHAISGTSPSI